MFGEGVYLDGIVMVVINVCCLEGVDFDVLFVMYYDGCLF